MANKNLMVSTTLDASHFAGCKVEMVINKCNFRHQLDDGVNIQSGYVIVQDVLNVNTIGVRIGHFQQAGFRFTDTGDALGFIESEMSLDVIFKTTAKTIQTLYQHYYIFTLNENVAAKLQT